LDDKKEKEKYDVSRNIRKNKCHGLESNCCVDDREKRDKDPLQESSERDKDQEMFRLSRSAR